MGKEIERLEPLEHIAKAAEHHVRKELGFEQPKHPVPQQIIGFEPDKWYGTCYGRDIDDDFGEHYK